MCPRTVRVKLNKKCLVFFRLGTSSSTNFFAVNKDTQTSTKLVSVACQTDFVFEPSSGVKRKTIDSSTNTEVSADPPNSSSSLYVPGSDEYESDSESDDPSEDELDEFDLMSEEEEAEEEDAKY